MVDDKKKFNYKLTVIICEYVEVYFYSILLPDPDQSWKLDPSLCKVKIQN